MRGPLLFLLALAGCGDTTGSGLVTFTARAGGRADVDGALAFDTGMGFHVTLSSASLHLGAVYLNASVPSSGGPEQPCFLPGVYVGEASGGCTGGRCGLDVDLLSPDLVEFPTPGRGTANPAAEAEVWLSGGDINVAEDDTPILQAAGTADRAGQRWPFTATVTIGSNRKAAVTHPALPGASPICRQRIVSPIPVAINLTDGGTLDLRIDAAGMWNGVDFTTLTAVGDGYPIPDQAGGAGGALEKGVTASSGVYQFTFTPGPTEKP